MIFLAGANAIKTAHTERKKIYFHNGNFHRHLKVEILVYFLSLLMKLKPSRWSRKLIDKIKLKAFRCTGVVCRVQVKK